MLDSGQSPTLPIASAIALYLPVRALACGTAVLPRHEKEKKAKEGKRKVGQGGGYRSSSFPLEAIAL